MQPRTWCTAVRSPLCALGALVVLGWSPLASACGLCKDHTEPVEQTTPLGDFLPHEALRDAGLHKHWQLTLPLDGKHVLADVYHVDETLYATTTSGWVIAIQDSTGAVRWMRRITTRGNRLLRPAHFDDVVVFPAKSELVLYNRYTGDGLRRVDLHFPAITSPVLDQRRIYLGSSNGRFYSLFRSDYTEAAKAMSEGRIIGNLVLKDGLLFVAGQEGDIIAATARNWGAYWRKPAKVTGPLSAGMVVTSDALYVPSESQSLFKLDRRRGRVIWRHPMSAALTRLPVITDRFIYQYNPTDGLVVLDPNESSEADRIQWTMKWGLDLCTVDDSHAYVLDQMGNIIVVRRETGEYVSEIPTPGLTGPRALPSVESTALYLYDVSGNLFCAKPTAIKPPSKMEVRFSVLPAEERREAAVDEEQPIASTTDSTPKVGKSSEGLSGTALGGTSKVSRDWGKDNDE